MRALILHRSKRQMRALRESLARTEFSIETTEFDIEQRGYPNSGFKWLAYDAIFCEFGGGGGRGAVCTLQTAHANHGPRTPRRDL